MNLSFCWWGMRDQEESETLQCFRISEKALLGLRLWD